MAPNRFRREKRDLTPFTDETIEIVVDPAPEEAPAEWKHVEAPPNFTWVGHDELAGMGWPKSRDQVRFLLSQGIDHLVTLSADRIPPHYAFPEMKWSLIPVEDFSGPAMRDIKQFINIMDEARRAGEAVGVHCAEGRGRTGVMCACFLIYYHDLKPWDAIRIMRRQRPGSVERKTQEDTVVRFFHLLQEYGKQALEDLEEKDKEWREQQRKRKEDKNLMNCQNMLLNHTATFYGQNQTTDNKINRLDKIQRMRRCRSMPKMSPEMDESEKKEIHFRQHLQNFYTDKSTGNRPRSQIREQPDEETANPKDETLTPNVVGGGSKDRAVTPGRGLVERLKKTMPRKSEIVDNNAKTSSSDFTKHFRDFMRGGPVGSVKRVRSFSQPKDENESLNEQEDNQKQTNSKSKTKTEQSKKMKESDNRAKQPRTVPDRYLRRRAKANPAILDKTEKKPRCKSLDLSSTDESSEMDDDSLDRASGDTGTDSSSSSSSENSPSSTLRPPQPSFKPKLVTESTSSYVYYTRVKSSKPVEQNVIGEVTNEPNEVVEIKEERFVRKPLVILENDINLNLAKRDSSGRRRAQTIDRDMCVTVTVTEKPFLRNSGGRFKYTHSNSNDVLLPENRPPSRESNNKRPVSEIIGLRRAQLRITTARDETSDSALDEEDEYLVDNANKDKSGCNEEVQTKVIMRKNKDEQTSMAQHRRSLIVSNDSYRALPSSSKSLDHYLCPALSTSYTARARRWQPKTVVDNYSSLLQQQSSHHHTHSTPAYASTFSRDSWKRTNHRYKYSNFRAASHARETYV